MIMLGERIDNWIVEKFAKGPVGGVVRTEAEAFASNSLLYGTDFLQYNPDDLLVRKGYKIYKQMMTDEQVKAVVRFHRDAVTGRSWYFEDNPLISPAENENRRQILTTVIKKMKGSFKTRLDLVMSSIYNGFSLTEKTFELITHEGKQWVGIKKLSLKPFETFYFNLDEYGDLRSLEQQVAGKRVTLDIKNFIHHVQNSDVHEYYGQSELREAYRAWYCKDTAIKLGNIFLERTAAGFVYVQPTKGSQITEKSPEYAQLKKVLRTIRTNSSMIFPGSVEVTVEHPKDSQAFERAVQAHDKAISKSLLMPNLLGLSEQGPNGSRALGDTQLEAFLWMLDSEANNLEEVINEQLFVDLASQNFPDGLYPPFKLKELSDKKVMEIMEKWASLVTGNAVKPTMQDEEHIRSTLGFPASEANDEDALPVDPKTALSGIQISGMLKIIADVGNEVIPRDTGIQILLNAFPINLDTAEAIMGEVGKGFKPKAPEVPSGGLPGDEDEEEEGKEEEEEDKTIIGNKSPVDIISKFAAAKGRVDFVVIDKKTLDIEQESVTELSAQLLLVVKPVTDSLRTVETLDAGTSRLVKFNSKSVNKVQKKIKNMLTQGWQLGTKHAKDEVGKAAGQEFKVSFARLDQDAAIYFDSRSFNVTGKLTGDMLAIIQNIISQSIKTTATTTQTVEQIYEAFGKQGFLTKEDAESEMTGILGAQEGSAARLNTVVRTNTFEAVNEARYTYFTDPSLDGFVEALEYSAILDSRTTQICSHLDGQEHILNGEVWNSGYRPPNHYNCRSLLIPITKFDKWAESEAPTMQPQEGFK